MPPSKVLGPLLGLVLVVSSVVSLTTTASAAGTDVGYVGPTYAGTTQPSAPTAQKPQSKLFYAYDSWWGALWNAQTKDYHVYRYDWSANTWVDSGSAIESRTLVEIDVLWDGSHLYVVSTGKGKTMANPNPEISRYSHTSSGAWTRDWGPETIKTNGQLIYSPVVDEDSTGVLWMTFTQGTSVWITHSTAADGSSWVTPYLLPTPNDESTVSFDPVKDPNQPSSDISSVVAFDGDKIGVLWSNQRTNKMYWASHLDGASDTAWSLDVAYDSPKGADDHINLKSVVGDPSGRVFAMAKTSNTSADLPLINLLALSRNGDWSAHVYSKVADNATRAMLLIDSENRELYVFSSAPCCSGGNIYYKKTSMDDLNFAPGLGTVFMQSAANPKINNPASTKQTVNDKTGILVLAGDDSTRTYMYNRMTLGAAPPVDTTAPDTTLTSKPAASTKDTTASFGFTSTEPASTFTCTLDGGSPGSCTSPKSYTGLAEGQHTFTVAATDSAGNTDSTPASYTWTVDRTAPQTTITAQPGSTTRDTTASFGFTSSESGSSFSCTLDDESGPCTSPKGYDALTDGEHTFTVVATDRAGNTDGSPATRTWTVDTAAPGTTLTATPASKTTSTTATFEFTAEDGATFSCTLDGLPSEPCDSGKSYTGLSVGTHVFTVNATDGAGNIGASAPYSWTVQSPIVFRDTFGSGSLAAARWHVTTRSDGVARIMAGAVRSGDRGVQLRSSRRWYSTASIWKGLPAGEPSLTLTWDVKIATRGRAGQTATLMSFYDRAGRQVLSVNRRSGSGWINVRDRFHASSWVRGPAVGRVAVLSLQVQPNAHGADTWRFSINGKVVRASSSARMGDQDLTRIRLGDTRRHRVLDYRVDNVELRR